MSARTRLAAARAALLLIVAACGGSEGDASGGAAPTAAPSTAQTNLNVQVASYDLAVGEGRRLIVGLLTPDNQGGDRRHDPRRAVLPRR